VYQKTKVDKKLNETAVVGFLKGNQLV